MFGLARLLGTHVRIEPLVTPFNSAASVACGVAAVELYRLFERSRGAGNAAGRVCGHGRLRRPPAMLAEHANCRIQRSPNEAAGDSPGQARTSRRAPRRPGASLVVMVAMAQPDCIRLGCQGSRPVVRCRWARWISGRMICSMAWWEIMWLGAVSSISRRKESLPVSTSASRTSVS